MCREQELELTLVPALGAYHLIRRVGRDTQVWFPVAFMNSKLVAASGRMSPGETMQRAVSLTVPAASPHRPATRAPALLVIHLPLA